MKTTKVLASNQKRRGIALVWVAIVSLLLIAFAGLLIDTSRIFMAAHQLHNAADAAALVGRDLRLCLETRLMRARQN